MTTQSVKETARDRLAEAYERMVTTSAMPTGDYGPDDAVFTTSYGTRHTKPVKSTPKTRSPLELLRDHSNKWALYGVSCPDLVFQTYSDGYSFFRSCLRDVGPDAAHRRIDCADGMCIARVLGVNLIWPEK